MLYQPWKAWTFALSRGEEVFVGILAALVVGLIIRPRHPLPEFQEILRSICRESDFLVRCDINDLIDSPRVDAQRRQSQRLLLRQILRLQSVLAALGREGLNLSANIALLSKACHSIDRVVRAVIDLQDLHGHQVNSTINDLGLTTEFGRVEASIGRALSDLPNQLKPDLTDLSEAVNQLDARVRQFLESSTAGSVQVDDLSALLRRWNILKEIYEELTVLKQFKGQLKQTRLDNRLAPFRLRLPQIDRRLFLSGLKGGLATVISLLLVVWLRLPGGGEVPTAAWTAVLTTSFEIPLGRPGDLRSMNRLMVMALVGLVCMISELLWMPYLSNNREANYLSPALKRLI